MSLNIMNLRFKAKKSILFVLVIFFIFTLLQSYFVVMADSEDTVCFSGGEDYTTAGSVATVPVSVDVNPGISCYSIIVGYDSDLFTLDSVEFNSNFAVDGYAVRVDDIIVWGNENTDNATGEKRPYNSYYTGEMFCLNFSVSNDAPAGDYPVTIALAPVNEDSIIDENLSTADELPLTAEFTDGVIHIVEEEPTVESVILFKEPTKQEYTVGDDFTADGGIIRVTYSDGTYIDIFVTDDMCSGFDMDTAGTQDVTITYEGYEFIYDIVVNEEEPTVESVILYKEPTKQEYTVGDDFTADGGIIRVTYSDGTYIDIFVTDDMCSGYDMDTAGTQEVTITYEDYEFIYDIVVNETDIEEPTVELIKIPDKIEYEKGDELDTDGGIIRVTYPDGSYEDIPIIEDMCIGFDPDTTGKQTITVVYGDYVFTFEIVVNDTENKPLSDASEGLIIPAYLFTVCSVVSFFSFGKKNRIK